MSTAAPARLSLIAFLAALAVACAIASTAVGAGKPWTAYLAPAGACKGSTNAAASAFEQRRAMRCLVNWARAQDRLRGLSPSSSLGRAAALKGRGIVACRQVSHTPCGSGATAAVRKTGYRYARFAENLMMAPPGAASPRAVVASWLQSPKHQANILRPGFREVGTALVRADGTFYEGAAVVWIVAFASPR
jgi:uncharacterized protein YkwD